MGKVQYKMAHGYASLTMGHPDGEMVVSDDGVFIAGQELELDEERDAVLIADLDQRHEIYRAGEDEKPLPVVLTENIPVLPPHMTGEQLTPVTAPTETADVDATVELPAKVEKKGEK